MVVVDQDGLFTGTANTILERYSHISKAVDAKDDTGASSYYKEVLYRQSLYVYFSSTIANDAVTGTNTTNWGGVSTSTFGAGNTYTVSFTGGADGTPVTANIESAYALFANPEYVDISLIMTGGADQTVSEYVVDLAGSRMDCLAFVSPSLAATQNTSGPAAAIAAYRNAMTSSSYAVMDSGWKYMYDKYNDKYRWVPLNGDIAGLCARTDNQRDPWFSPAGYQRGVIKNVIKLAFNPNKQDRDTLYKAGINPVVAFPGEGTILYGDKTLLARPSSFDRINVRRLFIVLEKAISRAAKASLFEFNDEFTRAAFVNLVEPFLRTVQGRRGIYDFRVVCDTTNNTPDVIDANQFVGDIYIKPARSVNFIQLNFVAVRTGVAFEEIVGHF
jgi:phage tail sheath protein FI